MEDGEESTLPIVLAKHTGKVLLVESVAGGGKSSLLAQTSLAWARQHKERSHVPFEELIYMTTAGPEDIPMKLKELILRCFEDKDMYRSFNIALMNSHVDFS